MEKIKQQIKEAIKEDRNERWNNFMDILFYAFMRVGICIFVFMVFYTPYSIGKDIGYNEGYTKGYDTLNNEIFTAMDKTECGNYARLNNYNQTIRLYKESCPNYDGSMFIVNPNLFASNLKFKCQGFNGREVDC